MAKTVTAFIPEIWSAKLMVALEKSLVYAAPGVVNRDYEGDIANAGDTVHVVGLADPTVGDYVPHEDITIESVKDSDDTLVIDQAKYFAFEVDDIEKRQALAGGAVLTEQARKAAYKLRDVADTFVAGKMKAGVLAANQLGAKALATPDAAYDLLVDLGVRLDENDVPTENRFVIVTPAFHGLLRKDTRFIAAGDAQGAAVRTNGLVGEAAGFTIRKSNNAPAGAAAGSKTIVAGTAMATSYAEQIAKTENTRKEKGFADIVKGLHLYGGKVFRGEALATAEVTFG